MRTNRQPITYLFIPGDRSERFQKALDAGADVVVFDLEDAVSPAMKAAARDQVAAFLTAAGARACLRVNGVDTGWFDEDRRLLSLPGLTSVMLPKTETRESLAALRAASGPLEILPIVETARGLANADALARSDRVSRLIFGSVDFQVDLGIEGDDEELLFARSELVLKSRLAEIAAPVDGVTVSVRDMERIYSDAHRARRLGFGGKLCIHPAQLAPVKSAFVPDDHAVRWARGVLSAAKSTSSGAITYEGNMVDKPVLDRARSILLRAE